MNIVDRNAPIGIFDSGVGGITVLGRVMRLMPKENFIYYGDAANFPYGDKSENEVKEAVFSAVKVLVEQGIKMLVVACNTATAAAIKDLRAGYDFPILGIEPAVKPATENKNSGTIAVLATKLTLSEERFRRLIDDYDEGEQVHLLPAVGLADMVESGHYRDSRCRELLERIFDGVKADTIVLGCTHYLFTLPLIREMYPDAVIIDGGEGLARNIERTVTLNDMANEEGEGTITVLASAREFKEKFPRFLAEIDSILDEQEHKLS